LLSLLLNVIFRSGLILLENLSGVFAMKLPENNLERKYKQVTAEIRILFKPGREFKGL
jgi:uncharacterized membrane protein YciS (DUF1049 family)